jgi:hypothetical protein
MIQAKYELHTARHCKGQNRCETATQSLRSREAILWKVAMFASVCAYGACNHLTLGKNFLMRAYECGER